MSWFWNDRPRMARDTVEGEPPHEHINAQGDHPASREDLEEVFEPAIKSWSAVDSGLFFGIRNALMEEWAETLGVEVRDLPLDEGEMSRVLREYGTAVLRTDGAYPTDLFSVRDDPEIWTRMVRAGNGSDLLPSAFNVLTDQGTVLMRNAPGMIRPEIFQAEDTPTRRTTGFTFNRPARTAQEVHPLERGLVGLDRPTTPFTPVGPEQDIPERPDFDPQDRFGTPTVSVDTLQRILQGGQVTTTTVTGGGRGDLVLDRDTVAERIRNRWRTWMREEPANLNGLVSEFESDAQAFWQAGGGQKDLEVWIKNRMRTTGRYDLLYGNKDESQSEEDYLEGFLSAEQFGLSPRIANREIVRGLTHGPAPASFQESVAFGRDVQALGQGTFSRRFAGMIDSLGSLQRA